MTSPADFQRALDALALELGALTQGLFDENYGAHWRDEEATTHQLLGGLVAAAKLIAERLRPEGLTLRATSTQKHREKEHGVDALIRFRCDDPLWRLDTVVLLQAKRQEPQHGLDADDRKRLRDQLTKMLRYTSEAFVMVYSAREGICLFPATAAYGSQSRDLFDLAFIRWPEFLSGVLRGRFGELRHHRVPDEGPDWTPMFELDLIAEAISEAPLSGSAMA